MQERELHQKQIEIEQQKEQSVLKLQLVEKEIELAKINASHKKDAIASGSEVKAKLPKLPAFCDGKDNMDAYLKRLKDLLLMQIGQLKNGQLIYLLYFKEKL